MHFSHFGLAPKLLTTLSRIGFDTPTPIQTSAIPVVLEGHDLIGIAQTGTGKTAAFSLPLIQRLLDAPPSGTRSPRLLVVAPTRELAAQILENVRTFTEGTPLQSTAIFGGVGETPQIQAIRRGVDILVATPGRLLDLLGSRHLTLNSVRFLVLDEADRMLDMGFLPQIRKVVAAVPKQRQTLLFSATFSKDIEKIANEMLRDPKRVEIGVRSNPAETVRQRFIAVEREGKLDLLMHLLRSGETSSTLVFTRTKHGADKVMRKISQLGVKSAAIHGNRSQGQRTRALADFKSGAIDVLVATDIAARGIDVDDISHVINFDFPHIPEDYVHRIGRTGRKGTSGDAISFITSEDRDSVKALEKLTRKPLSIERSPVPGKPAAPKLRGAVPGVPQPVPARAGERQRAHAPAPTERAQGHRRDDQRGRPEERLAYRQGRKSQSGQRSGTARPSGRNPRRG